MNSRIWLSSPHMSGLERQYIDEAFKSNWIAPLGPNVDEFEAGLERYLNSNTKVAALSSGTAAIHLALILLNINQGDEVICQSKTFSASANPIIYRGATPIFIESEASTFNICPEQLEIAIKDRISIGKKPKAIIAVHLYGMPYKVDEISSIAKSYDIPIIEDSAEALGSSYKSQKCGALGDLGILSFNGNKIITTSGGGALVCKSEENRKKAIFLSTQARENTVEYHHKEIGYNYRLSNVLAGIGRGQLEILDERVRARRENFNTYKKQLSAIESISFVDEPEGFFSNRWLTTILLKNLETREGLRKHLESLNIESRPLWKPMHLQPVFKKYPAYINGTSEELYNRGLCLPSGSNLSESDLERIIKAINVYFSTR